MAIWNSHGREAAAAGRSGRRRARPAATSPGRGPRRHGRRCGGRGADAAAAPSAGRARERGAVARGHGGHERSRRPPSARAAVPITHAAPPAGVPPSPRTKRPRSPSRGRCRPRSGGRSPGRDGISTHSSPYSIRPSRWKNVTGDEADPHGRQRDAEPVATAAATPATRRSGWSRCQPAGSSPPSRRPAVRTAGRLGAISSAQYGQGLRCHGSSLPVVRRRRREVQRPFG